LPGPVRRLLRVRPSLRICDLDTKYPSLIAYGVFQMDSALKAWEILFLIEGAFTVGFAVLFAIMLPWSPTSARFLTIREMEAARLRVLKDGSTQVDTKFAAKRFFKPLSDWKF
jgi:hypothetical protein